MDETSKFADHSCWRASMQQEEKNIKPRAQGLVSEGSRSSGQITFCAIQTAVKKNQKINTVKVRKLFYCCFFLVNQSFCGRRRESQ